MKGVAHSELDKCHGQPVLILHFDDAVAKLGEVTMKFGGVAIVSMVRGKTADIVSFHNRTNWRRN
jgi:hypothetical protein